MININNKVWNLLCADDIQNFLFGGGEENFTLRREVPG